MRLFRLAVVALAPLLVAQLAPATRAAAAPPEVEAVAVIENDGPYASITLVCRAKAGAGATGMTVYCEAWDTDTTSIRHVRAYPGTTGVCYFKANQMVLPIGFCARVDVLYPNNVHELAEDCHGSPADAPPQPPPTTTRTVTECVEPVPLPLPP